MIFDIEPELIIEGFLKDYKVRVNLLGGEPGLIKNLDEVITEIKKIQIMFVQYCLIRLFVKDTHTY